MVGAGVMDLHPERLPGLAGTKLLGWQDLGVPGAWEGNHDIPIVLLTT